MCLTHPPPHLALPPPQAYLSGNFGPVPDELFAEDLEVVEGKLPAGLDGERNRGGEMDREAERGWETGGRGEGNRRERRRTREGRRGGGREGGRERPGRCMVGCCGTA